MDWPPCLCRWCTNPPARQKWSPLLQWLDQDEWSRTYHVDPPESAKIDDP